jgi:hypothetical protein
MTPQQQQESNRIRGIRQNIAAQLGNRQFEAAANLIDQMDPAPFPLLEAKNTLQQRQIAKNTTRNQSPSPSPGPGPTSADSSDAPNASTAPEVSPDPDARLLQTVGAMNTLKSLGNSIASIAPQQETTPQITRAIGEVRSLEDAYRERVRQSLASKPQPTARSNEEIGGDFQADRFIGSVDTGSLENNGPRWAGADRSLDHRSSGNRESRYDDFYRKANKRYLERVSHADARNP